MGRTIAIYPTIFNPNICAINDCISNWIYIIKKAFIALGVFLFYDLILENIANGYLKWKTNDLGRFLPMEISDRIIPWPAFMNRFGKDMKDAYTKALAAIPEHLLYTVILTSAIWAFCYYLHKRRDL
jgi:ABC-2 type transport system permease protein